MYLIVVIFLLILNMYWSFSMPNIAKSYSADVSKLFYKIRVTSWKCPYANVYLIATQIYYLDIYFIFDIYLTFDIYFIFDIYLIY